MGSLSFRLDSTKWIIVVLTTYTDSKGAHILWLSMMREQGEQRGVFYELCSMIIHFLKLPPLPITFLTPFSATHSRSSSRVVSPAAFASLFLGISLALMLFGSVAFIIGFILMPLVTLLVFLFCFVYILSNLSEFGRSFLCPPSFDKDVAEWGFCCS